MAGFGKAERTVDEDALERHVRTSEYDLGISCENEGAVSHGGAQAMENERLAEVIIRLGHVSQSPVLEIDLLACELSVGQHE